MNKEEIKAISKSMRESWVPREELAADAIDKLLEWIDNLEDRLRREYDSGFRRGLEASRSYQAEAAAYKSAYFKLVEQFASLAAITKPAPIVIASGDELKAALDSKAECKSDKSSSG